MKNTETLNLELDPRRGAVPQELWDDNENPVNNATKRLLIVDANIISSLYGSFGSKKMLAPSTRPMIDPVTMTVARFNFGSFQS
jgi:hypothetical protein